MGLSSQLVGLSRSVKGPARSCSSSYGPWPRTRARTKAARAAGSGGFARGRVVKSYCADAWPPTCTGTFRWVWVVRGTTAASLGAGRAGPIPRRRTCVFVGNARIFRNPSVVEIDAVVEYFFRHVSLSRAGSNDVSCLCVVVLVPRTPTYV